MARVNPTQPHAPTRDRVILSKGHAAAALYATLAERGYFAVSELDHFGVNGQHMAEQPSPGCMPGVELATGSLGHGLSVGIGMALAGRIQSQPFRVFVVLSDGECNEGSVWEAAMFAPAQKLDNLCIIIDFNKWQATGRSEEVMALNPLADKFRAFGWHAVDVDGHDIAALTDAMTHAARTTGKPTAIIAHTVKGKGVSFMEDDNNWHYRVPTEQEVGVAFAELGLT